jgi:DNA-binding transcriptional ArsR family regulator
MLDQLRRDIQTRLDELLSEAEKLRHALAALTSRQSATPAKANGSSSPTRSRRRASTASPAATPTGKTGRPRRSAKAQSPATASRRAVRSQATTASSNASSAPVRTAPGATKTAVLAALAGGTAMTASDVASATGLGRASVSTTLSKLAKNGEVTKAARGYQIAGQPTSGKVAPTATKAKA